MSKVSFLPLSGERALVVGQTGGGKTVFVVWLLMHTPMTPTFIYDTKDEPKFDKLPANVVVETIEEMAREYKNEKVDYIIVRPPVELLGKPELLDEYLFYHYQHFRHSVAYIDELSTFHNNARPYKGLIALLSRGRSRGITTISSTQRPQNISRLCITEAQKVYVFKLADRQDRKRLGDIIPNFEDYPLPPKHGFYFFESGEDKPQLFRPIKLDKQFDTGYTDSAPVGDTSPTMASVESPVKHVWV